MYSTMSTPQCLIAYAPLTNKDSPLWISANTVKHKLTNFPFPSFQYTTRLKGHSLKETPTEQE
ncbi:hypothetical protein ACFLT2_08720 [Acidobacteriota bacterium]